MFLSLKANMYKSLIQNHDFEVQLFNRTLICVVDKQSEEKSNVLQGANM